MDKKEAKCSYLHIRDIDLDTLKYFKLACMRTGKTMKAVLTDIMFEYGKNERDFEKGKNNE